MNTAHIEGWGLYSEVLGREMGVFDDPLQLLGYYSGNLLRAARLVVDTGIHALGWERERAVEYLMQHTALGRSRAEGEVDRYITWPGQATAYKMGERQISLARKRREESLGDAFKLPEFHENVLACLGPMDDGLEECITRREMS